MSSLYFDNSATTRVKPEVLNAMLLFFENEYGNPSSMYTLGRRAKRAIESARQNVANLINANNNEIYFTSGGSESDNTALKGIANSYKEKGNHIITSKIEHPAVLNTCKNLEKQGFEITYLDVNEEGFIDLQQLENAITDRTILVSIMFANNEIGTIQPVKIISEIAHNKGIVFHTDAVQACGNIPIDVKELGIDMLSLSGHKIYGPKGVGALYVKKEIDFENFIDGGHQEKGKRAGTENVPGIVGLGVACKLAKDGLNTHIRYLQKLRDYYISEIENKIPDALLNGPEEWGKLGYNIEKNNNNFMLRLPGNANFSFKKIEENTLLLKLDQVGISVSSASACSSGSKEPSHVLTAIGRNEQEAKSALRVTFGEDNTIDDVDFLIRNIVRIIKER
ncbi:MAG: IscS subfamily cysteine desulfurase [Clostridia bacterium]|nr:IscS subfamily cysteine desulfurase [Clostridia bacterium]